MERTAAQSPDGVSDFDFGYSGWTADQLENGKDDGGLKYPVTYVGQSDAQLVIINAGINDLIGADNAATTAADILSLAQAVKATGKQVAVCNLLPCGSGGTYGSATLRDDIKSVNATLATSIPAAGMDLIDTYSAINRDGSDYAIANDIYATDGIHPTAEGGKLVGLKIAEHLDAKAGARELVTPPVDGSPAWLTDNPYMAGTGGEDGMADGFESAFENATLAKFTDADGNVWQQRTSTPGFAGFDDLLYRDFSWTGHVGKTVRGIVRIEMDESGWDSASEYLECKFEDSVGTDLLIFRSGYFSSTPLLPSSTGLPYNGLFVTPPVVVPATTERVWVQFFVRGSGTWRARQMGIAEVVE